MLIVGKLDREIYKCITDDIADDEVIITDERIRHIQERHPNDYERYCTYMSEIISSPDYILEANKSNTAVVLKEIDGHTGDTTWRKNLKNKQILYKRE